MRPNKFNVLLDLQWGSCGKGKFAPFLAANHGVENLSCSHRPNAGHTVRFGEHEDYVFKCLPSAVALKKLGGYTANVFLSAGAAYVPTRLERELAQFKPDRFLVHPRAMVVREEHIAAEAELARISSTMQGTGAALCDKIQRKVRGWPPYEGVPADEFVDEVCSRVVREGMLHEAAQGWELSLDHGHVYPYVTSRNCGVAAALDEMCVPPKMLGDVYGVFRPFPIRVGNFEKNSSGPSPTAETTWQKILTDAGAPADVIEEHVQKYEYTTVTKRLRRVFEFSPLQLVRAARCNSVTFLILNFAQYLDWEITGQTGRFQLRQLPKRIQEFVRSVEADAHQSGSVRYIGTGAEHSEVIELC
jgi:adenylosuccinate synthase